jgi:DNA-binding transcriptional regulator YiaG
LYVSHDTGGRFGVSARQHSASPVRFGKVTVAAWEQGGKQPSGAALKLLDLVEWKRLSVLT